MKKTKLFMSLITCCFALSVLAFGVYAMILDVQFSLSGKIQFEVDNIAQVKTLQVFVKDEDGSVFKTYDETPINKNGSDMGKGTIDQSIGNVESYTNQTVEIHIRVQSLTEKYVKISLTHNEIADNTDYTKEGVKVRTNSVILAPQSGDGTEKEFIIYVQYIDLGNTIQEYTLDNNFVVHFEELNDILQEDKENGYWYVEMGTIPTTTGSEYIRWRYFTSYIDPEEDGNVNSKAQYTYQPGVRPEPNEDGTGCFILETDMSNVKRSDKYPINRICYDCYNKTDIISDLENVPKNEYATSIIRNYINGNDVFNYEGNRGNKPFDYQTNMFKDFCIDDNNYIFKTMIEPRKVSDLYKKNKVTIEGSKSYISDVFSATIDRYKFENDQLPQDINNNVLCENDSDKFWLLSFWEAYYILGSQKNIPGKDSDDKLKYNNNYYFLRSRDFTEERYVFNVDDDTITTYSMNHSSICARPAFKLAF